MAGTGDEGGEAKGRPERGEGELLRGSGGINEKDLKAKLSAAGLTNVDKLVAEAKRRVKEQGGEDARWYVLFGDSFVFVINDPF